MTSDGTEVIEMPASSERGSFVIVVDDVVVGGSVLEVVAIVGMVVVATVAGAVAGATTGMVEVGRLVEVVSTTGAVAADRHAARSTTATKTSFDLTCHPPPG